MCSRPRPAASVFPSLNYCRFLRSSVCAFAVFFSLLSLNFLVLFPLSWKREMLIVLFFVDLFRSISSGVSDTNAIRSDLELARSTLHNGGRVSDSVLPIGIGYLGWILDKDSDSQEKIALALEARVAAIWFAFGNDLGKWIEFVRKYDNGRSVPHKTLIFVIVNSVEEAVRAAEQWKVDVLVVQGAATTCYWLRICH